MDIQRHRIIKEHDLLKVDIIICQLSKLLNCKKLCDGPQQIPDRNLELSLKADYDSRDGDDSLEQSNYNMPR